MVSIREITKSGTFAAVVFALVVVLLPFGIEQIGEATDLFRFPVKKTLLGWFAPGGGHSRERTAVPSVDWKQYREAIEAFTKWMDTQDCAAIALPPHEVNVIIVEEPDIKPVRRIWPVPVVSCTESDLNGEGNGYVFISGFDHPFKEGSVIMPSEELCGYEIVSISERTVWFRAVFDVENDVPMGIVKFPDFTRVEGESLVRGSRRYFARDAFPLPKGKWLKIDSFIPPDGAVFAILDEERRAVATVLCVVIGRKGGR